jgi:hypothetical protein
LLTLEATRRYARQIALPEVGPGGQARIAAARVVIVGDDAAARAAADYLRGGGVGRVELIGVPAAEAAEDAADAWTRALTGASLVLRFCFADDPLLRTAVRLGIPALFGNVNVRDGGDGVDLFAFRRHGPCPHVGQDIPVQPGSAGSAAGTAAVVLGSLAAGEALQLLIDPQAPPRARLLRLSLSPGGPPPAVQELLWAPECFRCGGKSPEASFT